MSGERHPIVYVVQIGKFVKIGFSTNLSKRLNAFRVSSPEIHLLLAMPGGRPLEGRLHSLLSDCRIGRSEMFRQEWRMQSFIFHVKENGLQAGLDFLESTTRKAKLLDLERRQAEERMNRAELDAFFAGLVTERRRRLGW